MGKTTASKLQMIERALQLSNTPQLISLLASEVESGKKEGVQINALSNQLISCILNVISGIPVTKHNLHCYKKSGIDILASLAARLSLPVCESTHCEVSGESGKLVFKFLEPGPVAAMRNLINQSLSEDSIKVRYRIWGNLGWNIGVERNWIKASTLSAMKDYNVCPSIPISHSSPTRLKRIYTELPKYINEAKGNWHTTTQLNALVDKRILNFCNCELRQYKSRTKKWLPQPAGMPVIQYSWQVGAKSRLTPYLYCKFIQSNQAKIGKAENSTRFRDSDLGVVICLRRDNDITAFDCESMIFKELANHGIHPVSGMLEHFSIPVSDLSALLLDICNSNSLIRSKVISISATTEHCK